MILKLNHKNPRTAEKIYAVFQVSYAIEAKILKAVDFPPLKRTIIEFLSSETQFYGYWENKEIAGVIEIKNNNNSTHIQSLVVDPTYFRRGIASQLIRYLFNNYDSQLFTVETGLANEPAMQLYKSFGFIEINQWDTLHGIRKIKLVLKK